MVRKVIVWIAGLMALMPIGGGVSISLADGWSHVALAPPLLGPRDLLLCAACLVVLCLTNHRQHSLTRQARAARRTLSYLGSLY